MTAAAKIAIVSTATRVPGHIRMPKNVTGRAREQQPILLVGRAGDARRQLHRPQVRRRIRPAAAGAKTQQLAQLARHRAAQQLVAALVRDEQHRAASRPRIVDQPGLELALAAASERRGDLADDLVAAVEVGLCQRLTHELDAHVDRADRRDRHRDHEGQEDFPENVHGARPAAGPARSRCRGCCGSARRRRPRCRAYAAGC